MFISDFAVSMLLWLLCVFNTNVPFGFLRGVRSIRAPLRIKRLAAGQGLLFTAVCRDVESCPSVSSGLLLAPH